MVLFFTITLTVSAIGLVLLLSIKRYELRSGRVVLARMRPALERFSRGFVLFVHYILPFVARRGVGHARSKLSAALAHLALSVETSLARLLALIQHAVEPRGGSGPASTFLQEVADHKRRLLRTPAKERAIFEE